MEPYTLPFATINILRKDIAEVIINSGVEMNKAMVNDYHTFLLTHLTSPFSLLINKKNAYTYDYDAQQIIANLPEIKALAVVVYSDMSEIAQGALSHNLDSQTTKKVDVFRDRTLALEQLISIQDSLINQHCQA